jgi:hypothetical protein
MVYEDSIWPRRFSIQLAAHRKNTNMLVLRNTARRIKFAAAKGHF